MNEPDWKILPTAAKREMLARLMDTNRTLRQRHIKAAGWPAITEYVNNETGKRYEPHHAEELDWIQDRTHKYLLAKGGEGGGKSVAGVIRDLEKARIGASGIIVSPTLPHFRNSLWPEFRRWCPWDYVIPRQRYRASKGFSPLQPFELVFETGAVFYFGGMKEDQVGKWEGPNVHFAHFDECRHHKTDAGLKVLDGRVRIPVAGERPQLWLTTTPRKHWLFERFGPWDAEDQPDPHARFKARALVMTLLTVDNLHNLDAGFLEDRKTLLSESEIRVLLEAEWEDLEDLERFLPSMVLWDECREELPPLDPREPTIIALDAAVSGDSFGLLQVSRHPDPARRADSVAVRYSQEWKPPPGGEIDFQGTDDHPGPELVLRRRIRDTNVVQVAYDPYQLHDMATRLNKEGLAWIEPFTQGAARMKADKALRDVIYARRIAHQGEPELRTHIDNADAKKDADRTRLRIVKRSPSRPVDLAVCASMASDRALFLNL